MNDDELLTLSLETSCKMFIELRKLLQEEYNRGNDGVIELFRDQGGVTFQGIYAIWNAIITTGIPPTALAQNIFLQFKEKVAQSLSNLGLTRELICHDFSRHHPLQTAA